MVLAQKMLWGQERKRNKFALFDLFSLNLFVFTGSYGGLMSKGWQLSCWCYLILVVHRTSISTTLINIVLTNARAHATSSVKGAQVPYWASTTHFSMLLTGQSTKVKCKRRNL